MKKVESRPYILFALLLGNLGIHKFYANDKPSGVMYMAFSITTIPGIIAFCTAIKAMLNSKDGLIYLRENGSTASIKEIPKNKSKIKFATELEKGEKPFYKTVWFWVLLLVVLVIDFWIIQKILYYISSLILILMFAGAMS